MTDDHDFVARLASLTPTAAPADPVAAAYAAGRESGQRAVVGWQFVGLAACAAALILAVVRPPTPTAVRGTPVVNLVPLQPPAPLLPDSAAVLERAVSDGDLPALPRWHRPNISGLRLPVDL